MPLPAASKGAQVKYYSSIVITKDIYLTVDFIEWFRGFVKGDGSFFFNLGHKTFFYKTERKLQTNPCNKIILRFIS